MAGKRRLAFKFVGFSWVMLRLGESRPRCYGKRRLPGANGVPFPTVLPFSTLMLLRRTSRTVYATVAAITMRSCDQNNGVPSSNSSDRSNSALYHIQVQLKLNSTWKIKRIRKTPLLLSETFQLRHTLSTEFLQRFWWNFDEVYPIDK